MDAAGKNLPRPVYIKHMPCQDISAVGEKKRYYFAVLHRAGRDGDKGGGILCRPLSVISAFRFITVRFVMPSISVRFHSGFTWVYREPEREKYSGGRFGEDFR